MGFCRVCGISGSHNKRDGEYYCDRHDDLLFGRRAREQKYAAQIRRENEPKVIRIVVRTKK